ncbi:MAG TPA: protein phosphatase 2C domain-containing protein [Candidatus Competibacter sp.]|nr:protein phosphatase 2C domain-containing protein [Candidatus Competibacteraceae bacterium]HRW67673.1 protein phosphatase 2C domain-containing protein [Candidatus Competibacter sp.]
MTITLDSHYTIGQLHLFCQDYVCHGWEPYPYVILADGCSAEPDSDVGARLLVLNARRLLPRFMAAATDEAGRRACHWRLGRRIVRRAARQARELGAGSALDATLLIAWCDGTTVYVHFYGDGCLAARRADGGVVAIQVEYAGNVPYYLSYLLDRERLALYRAVTDNPLAAQSVGYVDETGTTTRLERFDAPLVFSFSLDAFPTVAVATDGLQSFVSASTNERLSVLEVAREMLEFDRSQDRFVQRRLHKLLLEYSKQLVFNLDDLGIGIFTRTE